MGGPLLPLALLVASFLPAVIIFLLPEERAGARRAVNLGGAVLKVALVAVLVVGVLVGYEYEWRVAFLPDVDLVLRIDPIPLLFVVLSALLWLTTTVYAIGYLEDDRGQSRFFGFFSLCVTATVGLALAGNLVTFLVFYELLTVATYPLVVHRGDAASRAGGRSYLRWTLTGGVILLLGTAWLHTLAGPVEFGRQEVLGQLAGQHQGALIGIFTLLVVGLGVKAVLVPLHVWLPKAMVAPAPVSALLHAVAVVKAGVYGIVRVVHDLFGQGLAAELGMLAPLVVVAVVTILYGSFRALAQQDLKRRLAFSTVSQLSYITLGIAIVGVTSTTAGLAHLIHQGVMKVTLFYCAGTLEKRCGITRLDELDGVGRRMPLTMAAFSVAAAGMVGLPPTVGFVTKFHLGVGAVESGAGWVVGVLAVSSLLNAAYFLPPVARAWFRSPPAGSDLDGRGSARRPELAGVGSWLVWPTVATAASVVALGVLAGAPGSPLTWARVIAEELLR